MKNVAAEDKARLLSKQVADCKVQHHPTKKSNEWENTTKLGVTIKTKDTTPF